MREGFRFRFPLARRAGSFFFLKREMSVLRIYPVCLELVREVSGVAGRIGEFDRDMARQLRRSMVSVALNLAEGDGQTAAIAGSAI